MNAPVKFIAAAAFACGLAALAPQPAQAMPLATTGVDAAPQTEQAHAVRRCDRFGRCWWSTAGHYHRGYYGWRRPGYHYGWRRPYRHYGWGHPHHGRHWGGHRHWR